MNLKTKRGIRILRRNFENPLQFLTQSSVVRWGLFVALVMVVAGAIQGPIFRVKEISCQNIEGKPCDEIVFAELESHKGTSIFRVNTSSIKNTLEKANPSYQEVKVSVKLPNILSVSMNNKIEYSNFKVASHSATFSVDQNLLIVDKTSSNPNGKFTIVVDYPVDYGVGDTITDETIAKTFELADLLQDYYIIFGEVTVKAPTNIVVDLLEGKMAIFTITKDLTRQVTSLQLILSKATIGQEPLVFDMRFDKPVLK